MSTRPMAERTVLFVLGLSLMLVADAFAVQPAPRVEAATVDEAGQAVPVEGVDELACGTAFGDTKSRSDMSLHGVAITSRGAFAVGYVRRRGDHRGQRRPAALTNIGGRWSRTDVPSPGAEDGLVAVAANGPKDAWAVGFMTVGGTVLPLATRWNGRRWRVDRPAPRGGLDAMLTDVMLVGGSQPFAVGYRMTAGGKRKPIATRHDGRRWRYLDPRVGARESVTLTGVSADREGGLWVVGHGGRGARISPVILRRTDGRWTRVKAPRIATEAVLTDVVATSADDAWAVGYRRGKSGGSVPLVLHWDGRRWRIAEAPDFGTRETLMTAVSAPGSGGLWVVGAGWTEDGRGHEALAAWWDGHAWNAVAGPGGGEELHDVAGSLHDGGWAVGRAGDEARATRVCDRPQVSIFGGSEPFAPGPPDEAVPELQPGPAAGRAADARASEADAPSQAIAEADDDSAETQVEPLAGRKKRKASRRQRRSRRPVIRTLPRARPDARIVARNVASAAGVNGYVNTYGAIATDFDGDGDDDLYIGAHGRPGRLLLNDGGTFTDHEPMVFPQVDRHGCTAADIDGSGLPDLYCTIGGKRGSGLKANELWIDPGGPAPVDVAIGAGVADPTGRGRESLFLSSGDGRTHDLVVTNSPTRIDGLPSVGRLYRARGGDLTARARVGFAPRLGALSIAEGDFDRDGREDLVLVTGGPQAPRSNGTRLYRNTKRGLVDVTARMGISRMGEVDAALVDIDRDDHLDLVQLSPTRIRVSVWRKGRFQRIYERALTLGRAIAGGDVNGDRRDDLYIVRGDSRRNAPDVLLVNRRGGRAFTSMAIPQASSGDGDDAIAIDHDGNGLDDFLVLNGRGRRGPTQLIAFHERPTARAR